MSNYTKENLVQIPPTAVPAGTLALKVGNEIFTPGNIRISSGGMDFYKCASVGGEPSAASPQDATSNTGGDYIITASSVYSSDYEPWKAFSGAEIGNSAGWFCSRSDKSPWIQIQFTAAKKITSYQFSICWDSSQQINSWTLQGSNDGSNWTTIDSREGQQLDSSQPTFSGNVSAPANYTWYRLNIGSTQDFQYIGIQGVVLYQLIGEVGTWTGYKAVLTDGVYSFEDTLTTGLSYGSAFTPEIGSIYNSEASIIAATLWKGFADYIFYTPLSTESVVAETGQTLTTIGGTIDYSNHTALFSAGTYIQSGVSIEFPLTVTFKLKQLTDSTSGIFCFGETRSDLLGIAFSSSNKYAVVQQVNNSTQIENRSVEIIPDSVNFVQFALVCNGNIVQLYRDGEKIIEATNLRSETYNKLRINDMCSLWSYGPQQNEYLDLRIYNRALSADEIAALAGE